MTDKEKEQADLTISRSTKIQLVLALSVMATLGTLIWQASSFKVNVQRDISDGKIADERLAAAIERVDNKIVGKSKEGWHRNSMYWYSQQLKEKNQNLEVPNVYRDDPHLTP